MKKINLVETEDLTAWIEKYAILCKEIIISPKIDSKGFFGYVVEYRY